MDNPEIIGYFLIIFFLAIAHTSGEVIYKSGSMALIKDKHLLKNIASNLQQIFLPLLIIGFSIALSLGVKIIYGTVLGSNPLSITAGLFFGLIAIFSIIFGKLFFNEQITRFQIFGILLIALGILLLV